LQLQVERIPFDRDSDELAGYLRSSLTEGLAETEAEVRRKEYGDNMLKGQEKPTVLTVLWRQVSNAMTVILVAALIIAVAIDDDAEGGFIAGISPLLCLLMIAIVVANVSIGFFQEYRAQRVLDSLRKHSSPNATVIRNKAGEARSMSIPTSAVTLGDIVVLEAGQVVPADMRLFSSSNLQIDESILTGESITAIKVTEPISRDEGEYTSIGDCFNIAYSGTVVSKGEGLGIVYAMGMNTEIGKIAQTLKDDQSLLPNTPLRQQALVILKKVLGVYNTSPLQRTYISPPHI
jgi:Ca2+-transporting ATPase